MYQGESCGRRPHLTHKDSHSLKHPIEKGNFYSEGKQLQKHKMVEKPSDFPEGASLKGQISIAERKEGEEK